MAGRYYRFPRNLENTFTVLTPVKFNINAAKQTSQAPTDSSSVDVKELVVALPDIVLPLPISGLEYTDTHDISSGEEGAGTTGLSDLITSQFLTKAEDYGGKVSPLVLKGKTVNKYLTALYKGMQLRTFNYEWELRPESQEDMTKLMNDIVPHLRSKAQPTYNRYIVDPPHLWVIKHYMNNRPLYATDFCFVKSLSIDYNGENGANFHFYDGRPLKVSIKMELNEIKINGVNFNSGNFYDIIGEVGKKLVALNADEEDKYE